MSSQDSDLLGFKPLRIRCVDSSLLPKTLPDTSLSSSSASKLSDYFSQSHLALALAISKSKPLGMSMREYCKTLHSSLRERENPPIRPHRHVDSREFWKEQCERALCEKKALEDRLLLLEHHYGSTATDNEQELSRLEHPSISDIISRIPYDLRLPSIAFQEDEQTRFSAGDSAISLSAYLIRIAKQRKALQTLIKVSKEATTRIDDLLSASIGVLDTCKISISDLRLTLWASKSDDENRQCLMLLQQLLNQMDLSYRCCFDALDELSQTIPGRKKRPSLVYLLATFFDFALGQLQDTNNNRLENEDLQGRKRLNRAKVNTGKNGEYHIKKYLAKTLASIVQHIEWDMNQPSHCEIFEGILFTVLDNTGRLMSHIVFEEHVATSELPGNISKVMISEPIPREDVKSDSIYLIAVLQAVMTVQGAQEKGQNMMLLRKARKRIQATLVNSTVGNLTDTLKLPDMPEESLDKTAVESEIEKFGSEWVLGRVWALVGWDMIV